MKIVRSLDDIPRGLPFPVVTLGNFDGVHRGHHHLIGRLLEVAREHSGTAIGMTFRPHPLAILHPDKMGPLICTYDEKAELLARTGLDVLIELPFDRDFSELPAEQFVKDLVIDRLGTRWFVAGPDGRFGRDRVGDAKLLARFGADHGFEVESVSPLADGGTAISSSRIRRLVAEAGDVEQAERLLGRPVRITGVVVQGDQRGRTIGFPTANLAPESELIPAHGVYAAIALVGPEKTPRPAVVNIGVRPTFGTLGLAIEAHLLDFTGDLYGAPFALDLVARIRPEQKFAGVDALVTQIRRDAQEAARILQKR
jgi:riboflavin kinase/FMN adenylyltransferase